MAQEISLKQIKIDKANRTMVVVVGIASFLTIFTLVTAKSLASYYSYQNRVIGAKKTAVNNLKTDVGAVSNLVSSYNAFTSMPQNLIGGSTNGSGQNDGSNAKIIRDALPYVYDFPGLTSSVENLFANQPYSLESINGTDEELTQQNPAATLKPSSVTIPLQISASGNYQNMVVGSNKNDSFLGRLQNSIRPFQVQTIDINGNDSSLTVSITANTFYQPPVTFQISKENVQ